MQSKYIGFDALEVGKNGFELFKEGAPFLSLYHDCELVDFSFDKGTLTLTLKKVFDSKHGPAPGSMSHLIFKEAKIVKTDSSGPGNFEDVNDLTVLDDKDDSLTVRLSVGSVDFIIETKSVELRVEG